MLSIISKSLRDVTLSQLRGVLLRSAGIAIVGLALLWGALQYVAESQIELSNPTLDMIIGILTSLGLLVGAIYLIPAVTTLVTGVFLDDIAKVVERKHYGESYVGTEMPFWPGVLAAVQLTLIVLLVNLLALVLLVIPGINLIAFLLANGYLLGREYFELAALRHMDKASCRALRKKHKTRVFLSGLMIAGYLAIPVVNLTAPLFATALMVHTVAKVRRLPS